jgi:hypothetical protein
MESYIKALVWQNKLLPCHVILLLMLKTTPNGLTVKQMASGCGFRIRRTLQRKVAYPIDLGLVEVVKVPTGNRGGQRNVYKLTQKGHDLDTLNSQV